MSRASSMSWPAQHAPLRSSLRRRPRADRDADDVIAVGGQQRRGYGRSTPPDIATTTRVSAGALSSPKLFSAPSMAGASDGASISIFLPAKCRTRAYVGFGPIRRAHTDSAAAAVPPRRGSRRSECFKPDQRGRYYSCAASLSANRATVLA